MRCVGFVGKGMWELDHVFYRNFLYLRITQKINARWNALIANYNKVTRNICHKITRNLL